MSAREISFINSINVRTLSRSFFPSAFGMRLDLVRFVANVNAWLQSCRRTSSRLETKPGSARNKFKSPCTTTTTTRIGSFRRSVPVASSVPSSSVLCFGWPIGTLTCSHLSCSLLRSHQVPCRHPQCTSLVAVMCMHFCHQARSFSFSRTI